MTCEATKVLGFCNIYNPMLAVQNAQPKLRGSVEKGVQLGFRATGRHGWSWRPGMQSHLALGVHTRICPATALHAQRLPALLPDLAYDAL